MKIRNVRHEIRSDVNISIREKTQNMFPQNATNFEHQIDFVKIEEEYYEKNFQRDKPQPRNQNLPEPVGPHEINR